MEALDEQPRVKARESEDVFEVLKACYSDRGKYFKAFLPENFEAGFSSLHQKIIDEINRVAEKKKSAICATRGIGKTTIARGIAASAICFAEAHFIVYLGQTSTLAEMQTENIKKDLMGVEIRSVFGNIKTRTEESSDESWSKKAWVATIGSGDKKHYCFVLPRGCLQQVRGLLWKSPDGRNIRPDLIIVDDLEDPETIENEEMRKKQKEWFFGDVMKCFPRLQRNWWIFYIDTLKHEDSLMQLLLDSSDWNSQVLSICDDNYKSKAPDFMTDEEIQEELLSHREKGIMDVFAREIMCMAVSKEEGTFNSKLFKYYSESDTLPDDAKPPLYYTKFAEIKNKLFNIVIVDPARSTQASSAETGYVVWGVDFISGLLFLRYATGEKLHPDQIEDRAIELCLQYKAKIIGVEVTGLGEYGDRGFRNEIARRHLPIEVVGLHARRGTGEFAGPHGGKKMRIASMLSNYRRGVVYHNITGCGTYEIQLLGFPRSKRWDIMDAGSYITELLEMSGKYLIDNTRPDKTDEEIESEYAILSVDSDDDFDYNDSWKII